ncbi:MAG: hypothetical protein GQ581_09455 [Methyloprofundus sp.]|nr:hypothetical protein [Methyloprofundus sp.]
MQYLTYFRIILLGVLVSLGATVNVYAAPKQITLPADTSTLPLSKLPGYQLAKQKCMMCHSVDYIRYQPPGMNQVQWTAEVAKMKNSYGAWLSNAEIKSIGAYLAVVYGTAKVADSDVLSASVLEPASAVAN